MRNHLICWEENGTKKWEMVRKKDSNDFLLELMQNPDVAQRTIFIIPIIFTDPGASPWDCLTRPKAIVR